MIFNSGSMYVQTYYKNTKNTINNSNSHLIFVLHKINDDFYYFFVRKILLKNQQKKLQLFTKYINNPPTQRHTNTIQNIKVIMKC